MNDKLKTSERGRKFITAHEAEILKVYLDPVGLPTLGVGHLLTPAENKIYKVGQKISRAESQRFLAEDLKTREDFLKSVVKVPLNQNQFDALISFVFNIGNSAFKKSSTLRKLNAKDYQGAANNMLLWNKATGKGGKKIVLAGLTRRRNEERDLFLSKKPPPVAAQSNKSDAPPAVELPVDIPLAEPKETLQSAPILAGAISENVGGLIEKAKDKVSEQIDATLNDTKQKAEEQVNQALRDAKEAAKNKAGDLLTTKLPSLVKTGRWLKGFSFVGFVGSIYSYIAGLPPYVLNIFFFLFGAGIVGFIFFLLIKTGFLAVVTVKKVDAIADPNKNNIEFEQLQPAPGFLSRKISEWRSLKDESPNI